MTKVRRDVRNLVEIIITENVVMEIIVAKFFYRALIVNLKESVVNVGFNLGAGGEKLRSEDFRNRRVLNISGPFPGQILDFLCFKMFKHQRFKVHKTVVLYQHFLIKI